MLAAPPSLVQIDQPKPPPYWALAERALLKAYTEAAAEFAAKYVDERGFFRCIERWGGNEDLFWAFHAPACLPFKIPDLEEAVGFSFEVSPERAFVLNGSRLPFGCHAWSVDEHLGFWRPVMKRYGYEI